MGVAFLYARRLFLHRSAFSLLERTFLRAVLHMKVFICLPCSYTSLGLPDSSSLIIKFHHVRHFVKRSLEFREHEENENKYTEHEENRNTNNDVKGGLRYYRNAAADGMDYDTRGSYRNPLGILEGTQ